MKLYYFILSFFFRVPFTIKNHWQQYHGLYEQGMSTKILVYRWNENRQVEGDTVALLRRGDTFYLYKITDSRACPGSDWTGSNIEYDLRFAGTISANKVIFE